VPDAQLLSELPVGSVNAGVIEEIFRRLVLLRLHDSERLSEEFRDTLMGWVHSGFSVHAGPRVYPTDPEHFERLARYVVRVPMPQKDVRLTAEGQVRVVIPPHPRTGQTEFVLDPLEWIHQVVQQIPAPRQHLVRYYGACASRKRRRLRQAGESVAQISPAGPAEGESAFLRPRPSWARLLHRIFEIDPLLCRKCGTEMKVVGVIIEPGAIDKILKHLARTGGGDPCAPEVQWPAGSGRAGGVTGLLGAGSGVGEVRSECSIAQGRQVARAIAGWFRARGESWRRPSVVCRAGSRRDVAVADGWCGLPRHKDRGPDGGASDTTHFALWLIELQMHPPGRSATPMEWVQVNYDVIWNSVWSLGIVCVEAGANGTQNLDDPSWGGVFDRRVRDSGAIMVAEGTPYGRVAEYFTNWGSHMDAHAWGSSIVSTGYGDLYTQGTPQTEYTATFGGTSGASPMVTGSALCLQGVAEANLGMRLDPIALRALIHDTGVPHLDPSKEIGPRPDLRAATYFLLNSAAVPQIGDLGRDPRLSIQPNPISAAVEIRFHSPGAGDVRLAFFDASGRCRGRIGRFGRSCSRVETYRAAPFRSSVVDTRRVAAYTLGERSTVSFVPSQRGVARHCPCRRGSPFQR
jgi:hypothetical protein